MKLICYLSNGYPSIQSSLRMAQHYVDAGADIIEIDIPSKNPFLENAFIAGRMAKALETCSNLDLYLEEMIQLRKELPNTEFILMVYENTIKEIGIDKFIRFCKDHDYQDIILVGLKDEVIKNRIIGSGLRVSCYVQYQLMDQEVEFAKKSNGFIYLQAKPNPGQANPAYPELKDCIRYLRSVGITNPIYCGVGIHTPEDAAMVKEAGGDAVFVGSTILKLHDNLPAMESMIRRFKDHC